MFLGLLLKHPMRILEPCLFFQQKLPPGDFNVMSLGIFQTLLVQQFLELHEMVSVKNVKPRILKLLHSQTDINMMNTLGSGFL